MADIEQLDNMRNLLTNVVKERGITNIILMMKLGMEHVDHLRKYDEQILEYSKNSADLANRIKQKWHEYAIYKEEFVERGEIEDDNISWVKYGNDLSYMTQCIEDNFEKINELFAYRKDCVEKYNELKI